MRPEPTRIEPIFSPRIWGARSLAPLFPEKTNLKEPVGEAWLTGVDCRIASGPYAGKTLGEAWREMPVEWRGTRLASTVHFPLLVKFIFPTDKLSIQVHPDDAYAAAHEQSAGGRGKTEMWHAVSAGPGAQVLLGLKLQASKEQFRNALTGQSLEDCFVPQPVRAEDTFYVPAGTPHMIGPGMVLCEVQEYSDVTYRVYDYGRVDASGRPRELHIEKAMEVMNFASTKGGKTSRLPLPGQGFDRSLLAACRFFATERWELTLPCVTEADPSHFDLLIVLSGSGILDAPGFSVPYGRGHCWYMPANLEKYYFTPSEATALIRTYVPDIAGLREALQRGGHTKTHIAYTVFD
jgi:mannose-6-phosphate isomerase